MKNNKFIVSGGGFLSEIQILDRGQKHYSWVDNLSKAKPFTLKQAKNEIGLIPFQCFIWSPFAEEPIKDKYKVVRREAHYDFFNNEQHEALEWTVVKVHDSFSDFKFLKEIDSPNAVKHYSLSEAIQVAKENNLKILAEITKILQDEPNI